MPSKPNRGSRAGANKRKRKSLLAFGGNGQKKKDNKGRG